VGERVGKANDGARRAAHSLLSPTRLRGAAVEVAWVAAHAALYPLGALTERARPERSHDLSSLSPVQRGLLIGDIEAAGTPILLIHGMVDNRSIFTVLRRSLERRGFHRVLSLNYSVRTGDVRAAAERLSAHVEGICADTGFERIHVIGHSMGGLIARYYVQCLGGDERVHTLVTLGSPHRGTATAYLVPYRLGRQLRPGSDVVTELAAPVAHCRTRFLAVWSDLDQMIMPKGHARIDHPDLVARNVLVPGVGHMSLPIHRRAVHEISMTLAQLDEDGTTLTPGVTSIASDRSGDERPHLRPPSERHDVRTRKRVKSGQEAAEGSTVRS
jgi:triacylglycerol lipase